MKTLFQNCGITQDRNAHDYLKDFNSEIPLFERATELVKFLLHYEESIVEKIDAKMIFNRWKDMYEYGIVEKFDLVYIEAWLNDLTNLGYLPIKI